MRNRLLDPLRRLASQSAFIGSVSDEDAVCRVLAGDKASFKLLMRRFNQRLFRVARSIVGEESEAEDIVQQTYMRAFENLSQFAGNAKFSTWLTKIGINEALARKRRRRSMHVVDFGDPKNVSMEPRMVDKQPSEPFRSSRVTIKVVPKAISSRKASTQPTTNTDTIAAIPFHEPRQSRF